MNRVYRKTTTIDIQEVVRLCKEEHFCDREIARRTSLSHGTVRRIRDMYGLKFGEEGRDRKRYSFYNRKTTQFLCEGTVPECASALGMSVNSMYSTICRARKGKGRFEVYEVKNEQRESNAH